MLKNQTLFVVGAGASFEFGLPLGTGLAEKIANKLHFEFDHGLTKGDVDFFGALRQNFPNNNILNNHLRACSRIKSGIRLARSIDNYIDTHKDDPEVALCGKLAIIDCIANAERKSLLYFDPNMSKIEFDTNKLGKTWVSELIDLMFNGISKSNITSVFDNLSIICFNYDRCIQQAFVLALHTLYHFDMGACYEIVSKLKVIYPYGSLGALSVAQDSQAVPFGAEIFQPYLFGMSKKIRTYSEQIADIKLASEITEEVRIAKKIVFLGCAYHPQNVKILSCKSVDFNRQILGTAFEISDDGVNQTAVRLLEALHELPNGYAGFEGIAENALGRQIKLRNNLKCYEFMKEYRQNLIM